ncbi:hypothetical protein [Paraburkholderia sp.]|uniref:hypothetical protein n=1 Tax=Paraburkholderia sp. TaxID=1926495 RepID=UPI00286F0C03|nr:hypothetical protein [Paraburkholderia sp.]
MSLEIISGLIGGFFGATIANFLGRFRLWKVFVASMIFIYAALFLLGLVMVGFEATISKFGEFFSPFAIKIFVGLSALVTFIAAVGRTIKGNAEPKKSEDDKS